MIGALALSQLSKTQHAEMRNDRQTATGAPTGGTGLPVDGSLTVTKSGTVGITPHCHPP